MDEKEEFESQRDLIEYLASFWNPEAVHNIKQSRKTQDSHSFANDKEFERQVLDEEYKSNPYIQAIMKLRKSKDANNQELNEEQLIESSIKLPKNLKFLKDY